LASSPLAPCPASAANSSAMLGWCHAEHVGCGVKASSYDEWQRAGDEEAQRGEGPQEPPITMNDIICAEDHQGSGMSLSARNTTVQQQEAASTANWFSPGRPRSAKTAAGSPAKADGEGESGSCDTTSSTASTCSSEVSFGDLSSVDSARKPEELETRGARPPRDGRHAAKTLLPSNRPCAGRNDPFGSFGPPPRGGAKAPTRLPVGRPAPALGRPASAERRRPGGSAERLLAAAGGDARRRGSSLGRPSSGGSSSSSALFALAAASQRQRGLSAGRVPGTRHLFSPHGRWGSGAASGGLRVGGAHGRGIGGVGIPAPLTPHLSRHTSASDLSPIVENTWSNEKESSIFHAGPAPREEGVREHIPSEKLTRAFLIQEGFEDRPNARKKTRNGFLSTGYTYPLHAAVRSNCPEVVEGLRFLGADAEQTDSSGLTPLEIAERLNRDGSHQKVVEALRR